MHKLVWMLAIGLIGGCSESESSSCSGDECDEAVAGEGGGGSEQGGAGGDSSDSTPQGGAGAGSDQGGSDQGGSGQAGSGTGTSNYRSSCETNDDCADGDATYCLRDPAKPDQLGLCTILNCAAGECGESFKCCDCSDSAMLATIFVESRCFPDASAEEISEYDCVCE